MLDYVGSVLAVGFFTVVILKLFNVYRSYHETAMPGPKPTFPLGNALDFNVEKPHVTLFKYAKEYGSYFRFWIFGQPVIHLSDPELIKIILATKNLPKSPELYHKLSLFLGNGIVNAGGPEWKKQRTICEAAFHKNYLKNLVELMAEAVQRMATIQIEGKDSVDAFAMFNLLTLDVVTQSAFSLNFDFLENGNDRFWKEMLETTELMNEYIIKPLWSYIHPFQYRKLLHSIDYIRSSCYSIVAKRRKELQEDPAIKSKSILDLLLTTTDDSDNSALTDTEIVDNIATFFLAGSESTAMTLTWCCYYLTQYPEVQQKLQEEVDALFEEHGENVPSYDDFMQMKYMTMVLKETLRISPPVPGLARSSNAEIQLGGHNHKKGTLFVFSSYVNQRLPEYFPNPEVFDPERFNPDSANERHPFTFLPFSGGPRNCIGMNFAYIEMKITLSYLLHRYSVQLLPNQEATVIQKLILRPKDNLKMHFVKR